MRALKLEMQEQGWPAALLSLSITKPEKLSRFPDLFQCQKGSNLALHPFDFKKSVVKPKCRLFRLKRKV